MSMFWNPIVRQRELGVRLRRLREAGLLAQEQVAEWLMWSVAKVSRIETAHRRANLREFSKRRTAWPR
jgi:hypothetical protein